MKLTRSPKEWGKVLLPAFLLIISIQGMLQLPEIQVGFFPDKVWEERLHLVAKGCYQMKDSLFSLEFSLAKLNCPSDCGSSGVLKYDGKHDRWRMADFSQSLVNAWQAMSAFTARYLLERDYYLARKKFVHAEMKLKNLELMLDNILVSTNSHRIDGIPYFRNRDVTIIQNQVIALKQECQQYETRLATLETRLRRLENYPDKKLDHSAKVGETSKK